MYLITFFFMLKIGSKSSPFSRAAPLKLTFFLCFVSSLFILNSLENDVTNETFRFLCNPLFLVDVVEYCYTIIFQVQALRNRLNPDKKEYLRSVFINVILIRKF